MKHLPAVLLMFAAYIVGLRGQTVLPTPARLNMAPGRLLLGRKVTMCAADTAAPYLRLLRAELPGNIAVRWTERPAKADICWQTDSTLPPEAYRISVRPRQMVVTAAGAAGFTHAVQTLRQWCTAEGGKVAFGSVDIADAPRMPWRGFMLDSGRQYQQPATVRKYIDMAALLKMNYFHWHLTEGLGWRIEIKRYPRLAQTGGSVGKGREQQGYYTQDEIRGIVKYAAERGVTVVPEIDMPGHAEAALAAYPGLGCFGQTVEVPQNGFTQNIFCAGKEEVVLFLKNVLDEVCELFPSPYIHLGGDEAPKGNWDKCPDCQGRIAREGLRDSHDLQLWFSAQMAEHLKQKGRKAIFWGDVVYRDGYPLPGNAVIQWWNYRGHKNLALLNAARHGYPVICSPNYYTYLNFPVTPWRGYAKDRTFGLADAYLRNPADKAAGGNGGAVLGMTCALWTDYGLTEDLIDRRLFPRILALAELMWHSGERVGYDTFSRYVQQQEAWFGKMGYAFGPAEEPADEGGQ